MSYEVKIHIHSVCSMRDTVCRNDAERSLLDDDVGSAHASVSSSGHVTADVTVDMCSAACDADVLYFPFDRWMCSVDLSSAVQLRLTVAAHHTGHLVRCDNSVKLSHL